MMLSPPRERARQERHISYLGRRSDTRRRIDRTRRIDAMPRSGPAGPTPPRRSPVVKTFWDSKHMTVNYHVVLCVDQSSMEVRGRGMTSSRPTNSGVDHEPTAHTAIGTTDSNESDDELRRCVAPQQ